MTTPKLLTKLGNMHRTSLPLSGEIRIDEFWAKIGKLGRYANLCTAMNAPITCFNAPKVEGAFTLLNKTATEFMPSMRVQCSRIECNFKCTISKQGVWVFHFTTSCESKNETCFEASLAL